MNRYTTTMTPAQIRMTLNETIDAWRRSMGETANANARLIVRAVETYPWLLDQVPNDVMGMCRRMAKGLSPVDFGN